MYGNNLLFELTPDLLDQRFRHTDLGKLRQAIPFKELSLLVPPPKGELSGLGCKGWLTVEGGIALMIAKHYLQISDALLIERLNTDWALQLFCGIRLKPYEVIKDDALPGRWRKYLGQHLDMTNIDKWQKCLAQEWKVDMSNTQMGFTDATCYESYITYPIDTKLIWKCCEETFMLINRMCAELGLRRSRANHDKQRKLYLGFAKRKRKSKRLIKKTCRSLLKYLSRLLQQANKLQEQPIEKVNLHRLPVIEKIKEQQWRIYFEGETTVPDRIVSLHKPYVRPIKRGKETKPTEFGVKVNKLQVDDICFIEHISFDNFNEGTRLKTTVEMHRDYFGECRQAGADTIYATNENRRYCTEEKIATNFTPKGNQGEYAEQKSQMRSILGKARSTRLEGSFGNEKQYYLLDKIKGRTQQTEVAWIFFGMMCSNAVKIAKRRSKSKSLSKAA
jgi:hypothetical protein